jgi:PilZ domain-containing protein
MGQENRRSPRFPFIAVAEITDTNSGEQLDSRIAELSLNGCYVDMLNTLPVGSEIVIKIFAESECFEATAKVIYAQLNLGMGLVFQGVSLKNGALLRQWLLKASDAAQ